MERALLFPFFGEWWGELREESMGDGDATRSSTASTETGEILAGRDPDALAFKELLYVL
jgi:hypothetical protein